MKFHRNDVRVAEEATLEMLCALKGTEGSNPSRSSPGGSALSSHAYYTK